MTDLVDAHHHLWDPPVVPYTLFDAYPRLAPLMPLGTLAAYDAMAAHQGITGAICVEVASAGAVGEVETTWLMEQVTASPLPRSLVVWAPIEGPGLEPWLDHLGASAVSISGVRRSLESVPDGFALRPEVVHGIATVGARSLVFDLVVFGSRLREVTELVRRLPAVTFVLDHLGKPALEPAALRAWGSDVRALATLPNVVAKVSGLLTEATPALDPEVAALDMIALAIDAFGPQRLMVGTDWPVCELIPGGVGRWLEVLDRAFAHLGVDDSAAIRAGTASRIYGSPRPASVSPTGPRPRRCLWSAAAGR